MHRYIGEEIIATNSFHPRIKRRTMHQAGIEVDPETRDLLASMNVISDSFLTNSFNSFLASLEIIKISRSNS